MNYRNVVHRILPLSTSCKESSFAILPIPLILDTDMDTDTDCDDVGALAVARALQMQGHIRLDAVICSAPVPEPAPCARVLADYAGLRNLPN